MRSSLIAGALAALAAACSVAPPPQLLDGSNIDADPQARCLIPASYGGLGARTGTPDLTVANSLTVVLEAGPPKDDFFVKLVAGKGAFTGGAPRTGTFSVTGADASFANCGVCTNIIADIVTGQGPRKFYFADSGSVTLTATNPIAGSAQNLHFVESDIDGVVVPGCTATVASITFGP
jgi:ABC-type glycerol-3-phosphate transport system substrate-binding protein